MIVTGTCSGVTGDVMSVPHAACCLSDDGRREARIRVKTSLEQLPRWRPLSRWPFERADKKTVNDWMADHIAGATIFLPKFRASGFDLALALEYLEHDFDGLVVGELSLGGDVRSIRGLIPILLAAREKGVEKAIVPAGQAHEAMVVEGIEYTWATSLIQVLAREETMVSPPRPTNYPYRQPSWDDLSPHLQDVLDEVLEEAHCRRHVLLVGPPGSGKTMVARRVAPYLDPMTPAQQLEVQAIRSAAGLDVGHPGRRPFRAPHHTASTAALVGGGSTVRPGELSLAHHGVLFLDELAEFPRRTLEATAAGILRGEVQHMRDNRVLGMPAQPVVIGATSPCPCGFFGSPTRKCECSTEAIDRYRGRIDYFVHALNMKAIKVELRPIR